MWSCNSCSMKKLFEEKIAKKEQLRKNGKKKIPKKEYKKMNSKKTF